MADVITRLKVESTEYDSKIKRAREGLLRMEQECRKVGGTLEVVEKKELDYVKALGQMETVSRSVKGKITELSSAYTDLSATYKRLTDAEKNSPFGKALSSSLDQLRTRIQENKQQLNDINKEMQLSASVSDQLKGAVNSLGAKFGIAGDLTQLLTSRTALMAGAVSAGGAAAAAAAKQWAEYNTELSKQSQITTVTTGLKGGAADELTAQARALASTYDVDFREAIDAANTLMQQFGETSDSAMQLLRDGMQGMIQGDGAKLLSLIKQYAPSFHLAGISASELVAVIHNSEGGIFTDENMNAIVMGIKKISEMSKKTGESLAAVGIDGEKMTEQISNGTITVFDALQQVAKAIDDNKDNAVATASVLTDVFGRQGVAAGDNLGKAIASLNTNLEETKRQTGEVGEAFSELQLANERLEKAMMACFGYKGWQEMSVGIKTNLVSALATVLEKVEAISKAFNESPALRVIAGIEKAVLKAVSPFVQLYDIAAKFFNLLRANEGVSPTGGAGASGGGNAGGIRGNNTTKPTTTPVIPPKTTTTTTSNTKATTPATPVITPKTTTTTTSNTKATTPATPVITPFEMPDISKFADDYKTEFQKLQDMRFVSPFETALKDAPDEVRNVISEVQDEMDENPLTFKFKADGTIDDGGVGDLAKQGASAEKAWQGAASAISAVGSAMSQIEDPGVKAMGTVMQAIASIALGFAQASVQAASMGPWGWIAFLAAGAAALATTISTVHSLTGYADGGIIKGNTYSGDLIPANGGSIGLNAGELVLNKAQQGNLASQLSHGGLANAQLGVAITGEQIRLVLNANGRRTGRGEYITTNFR